MKNKVIFKLIYLTIIFIIILISTIITIMYIENKVKIEKERSIKTNLLMIQGKVKLIYENDEANSESAAKYMGTKLSELQDEQEKEKISKINISSDEMQDFYLLSSEDLKEMELDEVTDNHEYIVNYKTGEVILVNGIKKDGKIIYKLSELN